MKKFILGFLLVLFFGSSINAQTYRPIKGSLSAPTTFNFTQKANTDTILTNRAAGVKPSPKAIGPSTNKDSIASTISRSIDKPKSIKVTNINPTVYAPSNMNNVPTTNISFTGIADDSTIIPPDISLAVNSSYIIQSTNQEIDIYSKTGNLISRIATTTFFSPNREVKNHFNSHILYDAFRNRWIACAEGVLTSNNSNVINIAISTTSDPLGNWYSFLLNAPLYNTKSTDIIDFPLIGYNLNWITITANVFKSTGATEGKIYVLDRNALYNGQSSTINVFTDAYGYGTAPAETQDSAETTEYLAQNWNGNSGGYGYIRTSKITGTVSSPSYSIINQIGISSTWSDYHTKAVQKGGSGKLEIGGSKIGNVIVRNNYLWLAHTIFLPASTPTHSAIQWWQITPSNSSVFHIGRVEETDTTSSFFSYPNITINNTSDVVISHGKSSAGMYASACYYAWKYIMSNTYIFTINTYKQGLTYYYKDLNTGRNRWGGYFGSAVDPSNNSFWVTGEWANTNNKWATSIANIPSISADAVTPCSTVTNLSASNINDNSVTLGWNTAASVTSYNVLYRVFQNGGWTSVPSATNTVNISGLTSGVKYEWKVQSVCSSNSSFSDTSSFTTTTTCAAPTSLSTTSITSSGLTLNWGAVGSASSYNIRYRITGTSTWTTTTTATTSKAISGLTASTSYEWQVQTVCTGGNLSAFSTLITTSTSAVPCNAPISFTTSSLTSSSVTIGWTAASGAASYNIRYRVTGTSTWTTTTTNTNSIALSSLTSGTIYEYQVQTVCTNGYSSLFGPTSPFTFTTTAVCNTPTVLSPTLISTSSATLNWEMISGVTGYNVRYRVQNASTWTTVAVSINFINLSGLAAGTTYEYQVQATCSPSLSSSFTSSSTFSTTSTCDAPVTYLTPSSLSYNSATLNWGAVTGAASYNVRYRMQGISVWSGTTVYTNSVSLSGLVALTTYEWQVQANCGNGQVSSYSFLNTFKTPVIPCEVPTPYSTPTSLTTTTATLTYQTVNNAIGGYNVRYRVQNTSNWTTVNFSGGVASLSSLIPGTTYEWQLQTDCGNNNLSAFSSSNTFTTVALSCAFPNDATASSITATSATVSWTGVSGISGYTLRYRKIGATTWLSNNTISPSISLSNLVPSTQYEFQVQSTCYDGTFSGFSSSNTFTTLFQCITPTSLSTISITTTSATFTWGAVSNAIGYNIRYKAQNSTAWITANITSNSNSFSPLTLSPGTVYEWQVQTNCGNGALSSFSNSITFTTLSSCNAPDSLYAVNDYFENAPSTVVPYAKELHWTQVSGVSLYNIQYRKVGSSTWISLPPVNSTLGVGTIANLNNLSIGSYEWQVQSDCGNGRLSPFSALSSFDISDPCTLPPPNLSSGVDLKFVYLTWDYTTADVGYNIRYRETGTSLWTSQTSTDHYITISDLKSGTTYEWQVQRVCAYSTSPFSTSSTFTTFSICETAISFSLSTQSITTTGAVLNCQSISGLSAYNFRYRKTNTINWTTVTSNTNSIFISNLTPLTAYEWQVQAVCPSNFSNWSSLQTFSTLETFVCRAPSSVQLSFGSYAGDVAWDSVPGASYYRIRYKPSTSNTWTIITTPSQSVLAKYGRTENGIFYLPWTLDSLIPSTTYNVCIQTVCTDGTSSYWSIQTSYNTNSACTAVAPNLTVNPKYSHVLLSWPKVTGSNIWTTNIMMRRYDPNLPNKYFNWWGIGDSIGAGFDGRSYMIDGKTSFDVYSLSISPELNGGHSITESILPNTEYEVIYWYTCGTNNTGMLGAGPWPSIIRFKTPPSPCGTPILTATSITTNSAVLNLGDITNATGYKIQYQTKNLGSSSYWGDIVSPPVSSFTYMNSLQPGFTQIIRAQKICSDGLSLVSDTIEITPLNYSPYLPPTTLTTSNITTTSASLSWTPVQGAISYKLFYAYLPITTDANNYYFATIPSAFKEISLPSATTTSYNLTGLHSFYGYQWGVQAVYANGNLSPIKFKDFHTLSASTKANSIPTGGTVLSVTTTTIQFAWNPVSGANFYIVRYRKVGDLQWIFDNPNSPSITIFGCLPNTAYEAIICTEFGTKLPGIDFSSFSPIVSGTTLPGVSDEGTCANPPFYSGQQVIIYPSNNVSAVLRWTAISNAKGYRVWTLGAGNYGAQYLSTWSYVDIDTTTNLNFVNNVNGYCYYLLDLSGYQEAFSIQSICPNGAAGSFAPGTTGYTAIYTTTQCPTPLISSFTTTNITSSSAQLGWGSVTKSIKYNIRYRIVGTDKWTYVSDDVETFLCPYNNSCNVSSPGSSVTTTSYTISGLGSNTNYEYQIRAVQDGTYTGLWSIASLWSDSKTFKTL